jgi:hypothetical protein
MNESNERIKEGEGNHFANRSARGAHCLCGGMPWGSFSRDWLLDHGQNKEEMAREMEKNQERKKRCFMQPRGKKYKTVCTSG